MADNRLRQNDLEIIFEALEAYVTPLPDEIAPSENIQEQFRAEQEKAAEIRTRILNSQDAPFFLSTEEFDLIISSIKSLIYDFRTELRMDPKPKRAKALHSYIRTANTCLSRLAAAEFVSDETAVQPE